jgi:hypothetical protein
MASAFQHVTEPKLVVEVDRRAVPSFIHAILACSITPNLIVLAFTNFALFHSSSSILSRLEWSACLVIFLPVESRVRTIRLIDCSCSRNVCSADFQIAVFCKSFRWALK